MRQKGQVILILILVMTVALAIGLSIVQKSLVDVSTASKVEQSSRAFSAAEAGIEKSLSDTTSDASCGTATNPAPCPSFTDNNSSIKKIEGTSLIQVIPATGQRQSALEYPPLAKEDIVQVWLADVINPANPNANPPVSVYKQQTLEIYWGNSSTDKAALELTLVYYGKDSTDPSDKTTTKYRSHKWYLDQVVRNPDNGFTQVNTCNGNNIPEGSSNIYQCKYTLNFNSEQTPGLMLLRVRLLYNTASQPFAVWAVRTCGSDCSLPPQARKIISTGISGDTQRKIQLFQFYKVAPPYLDYAIFSAGPISK